MMGLKKAGEPGFRDLSDILMSKSNSCESRKLGDHNPAWALVARPPSVGGKEIVTSIDAGQPSSNRRAVRLRQTKAA
jgi:hypothetical protein